MKREPEWWEDRLNLVALIGWGDEVGEFQSVNQVEHFVEKPWLYEDLWREMRDSLVPRQGEHRRRAPEHLVNGTPPHQMSDEEYVVDRAARTLYARLPVGRLNWSAAGENVRVYYRAVVRAVIETYDHYESVVDEAL